jgi:hypothetical protein
VYLADIGNCDKKRRDLCFWQVVYSSEATGKGSNSARYNIDGLTLKRDLSFAVCFLVN